MRLGISGKKTKAKPFAVLGLILVIITVCGMRMHNAFVATAHAYANNIATTAICNAAYKVFAGIDSKYSEVTNNDRAMLFETDTSKLNLINSQIASLIQEEVLSGGYEVVHIPMGSITGIAAFSGMGPGIPLKIHPISLVNTDFSEKFDSCGINQVRHSVSLDVEIKLAYSGYMFSDSENVNVSIPVTDTVIVGNTPEYYGSGGIVADSENVK